MDRSEKAIFTVMCMVYDEEKILILNKTESNYKGYIFPGGHVELGEAFSEACIREVREETGLCIEKPVLCGIKQFELEEKGRYIVLLYKTDKFSGEIVSSDEGEVFWLDINDIEKTDKNLFVSDFDDMYKVFNTDEYSELFYKKITDGDWKPFLL